MRKVCLVNNYNYARYLESCLDSVVNQTTRFDAVYVVDDGSTDNSRVIIESYDNDFPEITPIYKNNGGQLSCFNVAVDYIRDDDLVFLLDSDDIYPEDYVEELLEICRLNKSDMYFCEIDIFVDNDAPKTSVLGTHTASLIPVSSRLTQVTKCWVGMPTSSMIITGKLFRKILPYPYESEWITRADDVLVYTSSLAGCSKVFIPSICVGYRSHEENSFLGKSFDKSYLKKRKGALRTLFLWCYGKYLLPRIPSPILVIAEYKRSKKYYQLVLKINACVICVRFVKYLLRELLESLKIHAALDEK
jgi:glycosyltransferase involved in cell wall biosynthesis